MPFYFESLLKNLANLGDSSGGRNPCRVDVAGWDTQGQGVGIVREDKVDCLCGGRMGGLHDETYRGLWVQCDLCLNWMHGKCVGIRKKTKGESHGSRWPPSCWSSRIFSFSFFFLCCGDI